MAEPQSTVTYKDIPGFPGYRAGDDGTIWSRWKRVSLGMGRGSRTVLGDEWHQLTMNSFWRGGYHLVGIRCNGKRFSRAIHTLVLTAFAGPCPKGMECCHNNGIRTDNRVGNLRWDTRRANYTDRTKHGNDPLGERNGQAKLTADQVRAIRRKRDAGESPGALAAEYGVTPAHIWEIAKRKSWVHVND